MLLNSCLYTHALFTRIADRTPWSSWDCWQGPGDQTKLEAAAAAFKQVMVPAGYDTMTVDVRVDANVTS
jgi:hypothetical protein